MEESLSSARRRRSATLGTAVAVRVYYAAFIAHAELHEPRHKQCYSSVACSQKLNRWHIRHNPSHLPI